MTSVSRLIAQFEAQAEKPASWERKKSWGCGTAEHNAVVVVPPHPSYQWPPQQDSPDIQEEEFAELRSLLETIASQMQAQQDYDR